MLPPLALACVLLLQEPLFPAELYAPGGANAIADLNGDGRLDVVCTSSGFSMSAVFGLATGGFGAPVTITTPGVTHGQAVIGDVNLDGNLDIVTSYAGLATFLGDGLGGFTVGPVAAGVSSSTSLAAADVDGDGDLDVLSNSNSADFLLFYRSRGDGTFDPFLGIGAAGLGVTNVQIGDIQGDGLLDLVAAASSPNRLVVVSALLPGFFGSPSTFPLQGFPRDVALGDVNHDGNDDAVLTTDSVDQIAVLLANGTGSFATAAAFANFSTEAAVGLGDLDGDGNLDLVATGTGGISRRLGDGSGAFGAPTFDPDLGSSASWLAIAPVSGDGHPDIVAAAGDGTGFLPGDGTGGFSMIPGFGVGGMLLDIACGDFDGDGDIDFAAARQSTPSSFIVALGNGAGGVGAPSIYPDNTNTQSLAVGDYDHDGNLDLLGESTGVTVGVMRGLSGGGFAAPITSDTGGHNIHAFAQADLDGDGDLDIIAVDQTAPVGLVVLRGAGNGSFVNATFLPGGAPRRVDCADINLDGRVDVAVSQDGPNASVRLGTPTGDLGAPIDVPMGAPQSAIRVADLNGDARPDLVAGVDGGVAIAMGRGSAGTFGAPVLTALPNTGALEISDLAVGSVSGNPFPDVVLTRRAASQLVVLPSDGGGVLGPKRTFAAPSSPRALAIVDFDGNGAPDIVFCTEGLIGTTDGTVRLLRNLKTTPAGIATYGTGTIGCLGVLGLSSNLAAHVGSFDFAFVCTNAPPSSLGLGLQSDIADMAGSDPFGLGVSLHVSLFGTPNVKGFDFTSDASGVGFAASPIPANPILAGITLFVQAIWLEPPALSCSSSPIHLVSSKGLSYAIAP